MAKYWQLYAPSLISIEAGVFKFMTPMVRTMVFCHAQRIAHGPWVLLEMAFEVPNRTFSEGVKRSLVQTLGVSREHVALRGS